MLEEVSVSPCFEIIILFFYDLLFTSLSIFFIGTCDFDSKMCICDETNSVGRGPDCFGDTPSPTSSFAPSTVIDHESSSASSRNDSFVSFLSLWIMFLLYL